MAKELIAGGLSMTVDGLKFYQTLLKDINLQKNLVWTWDVKDFLLKDLNTLVRV